MRIRCVMLGAAMLAGCGGASAPATSSGGHCPLPQTLTEDNFGDAFATAAACQQFGCSPIAADILRKAMLTPPARAQAAEIAMSIDAGYLSIDFANAGPCLVAVSDGCRAQSLKLPAACRGVLVARQPQAASCYTHDDCTGGYCDYVSNLGCPGACSFNDGGCSLPTDCGQFQTCVGGQCVEGAAAGAPCFADDDCQVGLGCVGRQCTAPGSAGAACGNDGHCAPGLFCSFASDAGACSAPHRVGDPCTVRESSRACGYGNYCETQLAPSPTCTAYGVVGSPCSEGEAVFGVPTCEAGLYCDDGGCVEPPSSGPCEALIGVEACDVSDYCEGIDAGTLDAGEHVVDLCLSFQPEGGPCDFRDKVYSGCSSGVCGDAGVCVSPGAFCPALP